MMMIFINQIYTIIFLIQSFFLQKNKFGQMFFFGLH